MFSLDNSNIGQETVTEGDFSEKTSSTLSIVKSSDALSQHLITINNEKQPPISPVQRKPFILQSLYYKIQYLASLKEPLERIEGEQRERSHFMSN